MIDGGAQIVVPAEETLKVQNQDRFLPRVVEEERATKLAVATVTQALH